MFLDLHTPAQRTRGVLAIENLLHEEIARKGKIPFHKFMERALYTPEWGYYVRQGPGRDYKTASQTSPAFGHLLASAFSRIREIPDSAGLFNIAENGAGSSELANAILGYLESRDSEKKFPVQYWAFEHRSQPVDAHPDIVWKSPATFAFPDTPAQRFAGVIFSNELFDALPVHRIIGTERSPCEIWVKVEDNRFVATLGPVSDLRSLELLDASGICLEVGQIVDVATEAPEIYRQMCRSLSSGIVLTIDYGGEASEIYDYQRRGGTLVSAYGHTAENRPLDRPGDQDLTAHVDFSSLRKVGEDEGLSTCIECDQRTLLMSLGLAAWVNALESRKLSSADLFNARIGATDLVRLTGMGRFRVLVQARGVSAVDVRLAFGMGIS